MFVALAARGHACADAAAAPASTVQLLPSSAKLAKLRVAKAQFQAVREKILGAAAVTCADTGAPADDEQAAMLTAALCAAGDDGAPAEHGAEDEGAAGAMADPMSPRMGLAPAGEGEADAGRRLRVRLDGL